MQFDWFGEEVELRSRRPGKSPPVLEADRIVLQCEQEWIVEGPTAALDSVAEAVPFAAERFSSDTLVLSFGNSVGWLDLPVIGPISLVSRKWGQTDFDGMLSELTDVAVGLPFGAGESAALPYDRSVAAQQEPDRGCDGANVGDDQDRPVLVLV